MAPHTHTHTRAFIGRGLSHSNTSAPPLSIIHKLYVVDCKLIYLYIYIYIYIYIYVCKPIYDVPVTL